MHGSAHSRARSFIIATNLRWEPATCTASATAASLPELMRSPCSRASTRTDRPAFRKPIREPCTFGTSGEIVTMSRGWVFSTTSSAVMSFVRLAIGRTRCGSRDHRTRPLASSNARPERIPCPSVTRPGLGPVTRTRGSVHPRAAGRSRWAQYPDR